MHIYRVQIFKYRSLTATVSDETRAGRTDAWGDAPRRDTTTGDRRVDLTRVRFPGVMPLTASTRRREIHAQAYASTHLRSTNRARPRGQHLAVLVDVLIL